MKNDWQPTTSHAQRVARASLLRSIREFFFQREVLEVETPLLAHGTVTDIHLRAFATDYEYSESGETEKLYLQTSPEYAMKRLLCAQSGPVYQICKAFRHEGAGRWHSPEFTMLEWYRPGFDHFLLMDELDALLALTLKTPAAQRSTYQALFRRYLKMDPLTISHAHLVEVLHEQKIDIDDPQQLHKDGLLQLLFSYCIEPQIGQDRPCFVYGFPASQAALARLNLEDLRIADRFELYFKGAELANGFYELADEKEQRARFVRDNSLRQEMGLPDLPVDSRLLDALEAGLPDCAGVALGLDRLLMLQTGAAHIQEVINFPVSRA